MEIEELLHPRFKVIADYPRNEHYENVEVGEVIDAWHPNKVVQRNFTNFYEKYPHLFKKLEWWEERKIEDMPMYVKRTGMVDSFDNPIPDWYFKVKKHFNCGNGEWRLNSSQIFCVEKNEVIIGTGMNYFEFEPATKEEYLSNIAVLETIQK